MARTFTKNSDNRLELRVAALSDLTIDAPAISLAARVNIDTFDADVDGDVLISGVIDTAASRAMRLTVGAGVVRCQGRSEPGDVAQEAVGATALPTDTWLDVGGVLNFAGDAVRVYLGGVQDGTASVTFGASAYTPGAPTGVDRIGAAGSAVAPVVSRQVAGEIEYVAMWNGDIGAAGFELLGDGLDPLFVRPDLLVFRLAVGMYAERDVDGISGLTATVIGSLPIVDGLTPAVPSDVQVVVPRVGEVPGVPGEHPAGMLLLGVG